MNDLWSKEAVAERLKEYRNSLKLTQEKMAELLEISIQTYKNNDIVYYVKKMREVYQVKDLKVYYRYRPEIRNDPVKDKEADEFLGLYKSYKEIEFNEEKAKEFKRQMTYISKMLPELKIDIQSK